MSATDINQYNTSYCPSQKYYKQNVTNYMKNPKNQVQDFVCDDNASEDRNITVFAEIQLFKIFRKNIRILLVLVAVYIKKHKNIRSRQSV